MGLSRDFAGIEVTNIMPPRSNLNAVLQGPVFLQRLFSSLGSFRFLESLCDWISKNIHDDGWDVPIYLRLTILFESSLQGIIDYFINICVIFPFIFTLLDSSFLYN